MAVRAISTSAPAMPLAPVSSNVIQLKPDARPGGAVPVLVAFRLRDHLTFVPGITGADIRHAVESEIERLVSLLDAFDGDDDDEDNGDLEPSVGAASVYINGRFESDLELDDMDSEGDELDAREGDELDRGEADWGDYDSGDPISGGGSGDL